MKIIRLETLAALRVTASNYEEEAKKAKQLATFGSEVDNAAEAKKFEAIARELREIIADKAHERAYATARWVTSGISGISPADVRAIAAAVSVTEAAEEFVAGNMLPDEGGIHYRARLVYYYDPTTGTNRWALEYTVDKERPAISDNENREDAEFRYREITEYMGRLRT